jgi:hypothetical protein
MLGERTETGAEFDNLISLSDATKPNDLGQGVGIEEKVLAEFTLRR